MADHYLAQLQIAKISSVFKVASYKWKDFIFNRAVASGGGRGGGALAPPNINTEHAQGAGRHIDLLCALFGKTIVLVSCACV